MDIRGLDLDSAGETDAWYRALSTAESADLVAPVVLGPEAVLTSLRSNDTNPSSDRRAFGAWRGAECVGAAVLGLPRHGFALACGFTPRHTEVRLLLELPVADEKLRALEEAAARRAGEYRVAGWTGVPPRDAIEQLARLHTMMDVDVPAGELSREPTTWDANRVLRTLERRIEQGYHPVTTLISGLGAEPAGYTTMLAMDGESMAVIQDNTFVLRSCRGRGLGMLAKIANLRLLAAQAPQARHVHTWTAEVNGAMHSVNERLGFRPVETMYEVEAAI